MSEFHPPTEGRKQMSDDENLLVQYGNTVASVNGSYGKVMDAIDEAFRLSGERMKDEAELKRLRAERAGYDKEIEAHKENIRKQNLAFMEQLMKMSADWEQDRQALTAARDAAVKEAAMWKKSYEDLSKCL